MEYPTSHLYFLVYARAFRWVFIPGKYKWRVGYSGHGHTVGLMTRLQRTGIFLWAGGNGCQGYICILRIAQELACNGGWGLAWHEGLFWWHSHCGCRYCSPHWKLTELDACMKKVLLWYFTWTHQMSKESHTTCQESKSTIPCARRKSVNIQHNRLTKETMPMTNTWTPSEGK